MAQRCDKKLQNATDSGLSSGQELALAALLGGATVSGAAGRAGVTRCTVHRWLADPLFAAELNRRRQELQASLQARLVRLAGLAVKTLGDAMRAGDAKSALALLTGLGLLPGQLPAVGETDAEEIIDRLAAEKVKKQIPRIKAKRRATMPPEQRLTDIAAERQQPAELRQMYLEIARDEVLAELEQQRGNGDE